MSSSKKHGSSRNHQMDKMVNAIDQLALFEQFRTELLPSLQSDLSNGLSDDEIIQKYKPYVAARKVMNALFETDSAKSNTAAKDLLDRASGKPTEKREVTHRLANLPEKEIDAVIASKMKRLNSGRE